MTSSVIEALEMTRVLKTSTHTLCLREPQAPLDAVAVMALEMTSPVIEALEMTRVLTTSTYTLCLREPQAPLDAVAVIAPVIEPLEMANTGH